LSDGSLAFTFVAAVSGDGKLLNTKSLPKQASTGREWEGGRVRFWSEYHSIYASTVFYTTLVKTDSRFKLSKSPPVDAFQNCAFIFPYTTDPDEFGYDVSPSGILITTVDDVNHDSTKVWFGQTFYIRLKTFTETSTPEPIIVSLPDMGPSANAVFSPDGKYGAVIRLESPKRLLDNPKIYIFKTDSPTQVKELPILNESKEDWDLFPEIALWSQDNRSLYVRAQRREINTLFRVSVPEFNNDHVVHELPPVVAQPLNHAGSGSVSSVHRLGCGASLFVNSSSITDNKIFSIVDKDGSSKVIFSGSNNGARFGLSRSQVSGFLYPGDGGHKIQCLVVLPSDFDETNTYPVLLLVHGGPASAWGDAWSTRWNPALLAEQGYIVLMPNITGSMGFGQKFKNDNFADWGGRPYRDLERLWDFVEANLSYADTNRAAIMGGSYGGKTGTRPNEPVGLQWSGYMMCWVAGQPLAKKFKTLVCHDGIFTMPSMLAADVAVGLDLAVGAHYWDDMSKWDAQDPSRNVSEWTQPMLIIHSDLDYRCEYLASIVLVET
jgi:dipeptidyl aminopeptidase/acylaminoacyl peptidase